MNPLNRSCCRLRRLAVALLFSLSTLDAVAQRASQNAVLGAPTTEQTAVGFYWFGDIDSHFRLPMDFHTVADDDPKMHTVNVSSEVTGDGEARAYISRSEMKGLIEGLESLRLSWYEEKQRESLKYWRHHGSWGTLDITVLSSKAATKSHIRIAMMCEQLETLDSLMPTPRILWQFQTFRWDNGCKVPGYHNETVPAR